MTKVVFITGASSGIGRAIGEYLHQKGYKVYGSSRNPKHKERNGITFLTLDVTDNKSIETAVEEIINRENRLDFLINNAGKGITGALEETPEEEVKKVFDVNFIGVLRVIKAVLPIMREQHSGMIINITSIAGYMGLPFRGIYSATKSALEQTTETFRMELNPFNIKMTNVAPGDFKTNIAAGRYHTPVYENSPYKEIYSRTLKEMDEGVDKGLDPIRMAKKVHRIMRRKNPSIHYKVGEFIQKISIVLKHVLPDKIYEKLLMNYYKL